MLLTPSVEADDLEEPVHPGELDTATDELGLALDHLLQGLVHLRLVLDHELVYLLLSLTVALLLLHSLLQRLSIRTPLLQKEVLGLLLHVEVHGNEALHSDLLEIGWVLDDLLDLPPLEVLLFRLEVYDLVLAKDLFLKNDLQEPIPAPYASIMIRLLDVGMLPPPLLTLLP
mmetsp:Transcript_40084/g.38603  ORF Transcript_40084/g.38603 Transcript_40084/m.38603 type:complete len:172 (+) Transcript_40084:855-1370(+)